MIYSNRLAVVTGASSGIGMEFAIQLHSQGARVLLVARRTERIEQLAQELNALREGSAEAFSVDLCEDARNPDTVFHKLLRFLESQPVDILINNAGRGSFGYFEELDIESEIDMIRLNIEATMRIAAAVIPGMKRRRYGRIVSVSSIAAFQPLPLMATYGASKAFNYSHSMALRYELAKFGVKCLALCPGPVETEFGGVARVPGKMTGLPREDVYKVVEQAIKQLEKNSSKVIPGLRGKLMGFPSRILPARLTTFFTGQTLFATLRAVRKDA